MLGDFFRAVLGIPNINRPVDPNNGFPNTKEGDVFDPFFQPADRDHGGGFSGTFPGGSFFFGTWPPPGSIPGEGVGPGEGPHPGMGPPSFDPFRGGSSDMDELFGHFGDTFRHFDEMIKTFDSVFGSMGTGDFSAFGHAHPSIEAPPPGEGAKLSPRDSMLKEPDSSRHHDNKPSEQLPSPPELLPTPPDGRGSRSQEDSQQQGPGSLQQPPFPPFGWFFSTPPTAPTTPPVMPQDPLDSDLDDEVRRGDLLQILRPDDRTKPFSGVRIMEPRSKQRPEGHIKSVRLYTYRRADGKVEERRTVEDGYGNKETTVTRTLDDQSHSVTTRRQGDRGGDEDVIQHYQNMDENDKRAFDERWRQAPPLGESVNPLNRTDKVFDLFRKGFPGFPSKS